jgi:hydrogenase expression/formation protein HypC
MCLSIPGKLTSISAQLDDTFRIGKVSFGGIQREVNLSMVPEARIGDYVLVHVGVAIGIMDEAEAHKTIEYLLKTENLDEEINPPVS